MAIFRRFFYFDHDDRLLNDVIHFRLDQIDQRGDATLGRLFDFDRTATDRSNGFSNEIHVDLRRVSKRTENRRNERTNERTILLFQFGENLNDVRFARQTNHDVQFLQLHVNRIVVLDEEHFDLFLQHIGSKIPR